MAISSPYLYSDWITSTYPTGSQARLDRLRLHIQEVSDLISAGRFSNNNTANDFDAVERYLEKLLKKESDLELKVKKASGAPFIKGRIR